MKEAAEAWAGMRSRLGLVQVFCLKSLTPILVAIAAGQYDVVSRTCPLEPRGSRANRQGGGGWSAHMTAGELGLVRAGEIEGSCGNSRDTGLGWWWCWEMASESRGRERLELSGLLRLEARRPGLRFLGCTAG